MIKHLDLFSGIGGFALAVDWAIRAEHIFCEIDPFCQKILKKHWPNSPIYGDIKKLKTNELERIDLLTGGFPCQPFSVAGKRRAQEDDRHLWPHMLRVIAEVQPTWIIGENVAGIGGIFQYEMQSELEGEIYSSSADATIDSSRVRERIGQNILYMVVEDLEKIGYSVQVFIIPACAVNAPHRRDRVWIIAHRNSERGHDRVHSGEKRQIETSKIGKISPDKSERQRFEPELGATDRVGFAPNSNGERLKRGAENPTRRQRIECEKQFARFCNNNDWQDLPKPGISRGDDGLPDRLDRSKAIGNAIVPQVAYQIIKAIFDDGF